MSPKAVGYNEAELSPHCTGPPPPLPVTLLTVSGAALLYFSGACARIMRRGFPLTDSMGYG